MKKYLFAALIATVSTSVMANDWKLNFPESKKHFVKVQKGWAEKDPQWNPTQEELEAKFDELDTDGDGLLSQEEYDSRKKNKGANGKKAKSSGEKNDWSLSFPESKQHFVKVQKTWAKKDPQWNPTQEDLEAKFDQLDTNGDGLLSQEEYDNR